MFKVYNVLSFTNANSHKVFATTKTMHVKSVLHQGSVTEHHRSGRGGGLSDQTLLSHRSGSWRCELMVPAWPGSGEGLFLACPRPPSCCGLTCVLSQWAHVGFPP